MPKVSLWVADRDESESSRLFIDALRESEMLRVSPDADESVDVSEIERKVADGDASHVLVIESGFAESIEQGTQEKMRLIRDPGREMEQRLIGLGITQAMFSVRGNDYWSELMQKQFSEAGMPESQLQIYRKQAAGMTEVIEQWIESEDENPLSADGQNPFGMMDSTGAIATEDVAPPSRPKRMTYQLTQSVAGVSVMMLMFGLASCGTTLLRERDSGAMARLLSVSMPRGSILLGKTAFTVVVGMIQMIVMLTYGELVFRIGVFRDPVSLLVIAATWTLAATGFGILIAAFSRTPKQAESLTPIITLTLAALGGCMFPLQLLDLPTPVEMLAKSTVTYWAMTAFQGYFWDGMSLSHPKIAFAIVVQIGFAIAMLGLANVLFRRNFLRG